MLKLDDMKSLILKSNDLKHIMLNPSSIRIVWQPKSIVIKKVWNIMNEIFSHIVKHTSIRVLLLFAMSIDMELEYLDVKLPSSMRT